MSAEIRRLRENELGTLVDWAAAEGWNPGLADARAFRVADPQGFIGAFVNGRMAAGISVVAYDDAFGFLGLYICHTDFRGRGLGRAVWNAGMDYLGDRTVGLDGVPAQQDNYRRMGFVTHYETMRMCGLLPGAAAQSCEVSALSAPDSVLALDRSCFPADRRAFLNAWMRPPNMAFVAMRGDRVCGYVVVRPCRAGQKVGPLFAEDADVAMDLLGALSGPVQVDVPMAQTQFMGALEQMGFAPQFGTARMYRGPRPDISLERVFGVTTLELG